MRADKRVTELFALREAPCKHEATADQTFQIAGRMYIRETSGRVSFPMCMVVHRWLRVSLGVPTPCLGIRHCKHYGCLPMSTDGVIPPFMLQC